MFLFSVVGATNLPLYLPFKYFASSTLILKSLGKGVLSGIFAKVSVISSINPCSTVSSTIAEVSSSMSNLLTQEFTFLVSG